MAGLVFKREKFYLKFAIKHHVGNVNDVAVTNRYVASCGADERVFLFTNKAEQKLTAAQRAKLQAAGETMAVRLADLGSLTPPCEVLCLCFTTGSQFLLCGCADGRLLVYRTRDWMLNNSLDVHEKGLVSLAVHAQSGGALVISVGADRSVAVLDLAEEKIITKWKYTPVIADADAEEKDRRRGDKTRPSPTRRSTRSCSSTRTLCSSATSPRRSFYARLDQDGGAVELLPVSMLYPEAVKTEAEALLATPIHTDAEVRKKNPLRHVSRVKALRNVGKTLFSLDSNGIIISWTLQKDANDGACSCAMSPAPTAKDEPPLWMCCLCKEREGGRRRNAANSSLMTI
ncbi:uncharacterized protein LOC126766702 [Bactrocera neohumeralis]|uniref:uncharacterized protein LOC126766702 n=1 Tax=Bactrocera neohumeralis TaxID=98809 RepID=UPI0021662429|nr:uncharacterized protein LOC126766702 [Bactrocera neohumeralis]